MNKMNQMKLLLLINKYITVLMVEKQNQYI